MYDRALNVTCHTTAGVTETLRQQSRIFCVHEHSYTDVKLLAYQPNELQCSATTGAVQAATLNDVD